MFNIKRVLLVIYMSDLRGGLYSSKSAQQKLIKVFMQLHQCVNCREYFTELKNIGGWECKSKYHPGKWDYNRMAYTCCGEKATRNYGDHSALDHYMHWNRRERLLIPPILSSGCTRCDCVSTGKNPIPQGEILVHNIASMIPAMEKYGRKLKERPGFLRSSDVKKMKLVRKERLPEQCFASEEWS